MCVAMSHAQEGINKPIRYDDEPKVVYLQNFEGSKDWQTIRLNSDPKRPTTLYTWQAQPVDKIEQVTYYKRTATDNPSSGTNIYNGDHQWEIAGVRDTLIDMYDGVMRTDAAWPEDSTLQWDSHAIMDHTDATQHGEGGNKEYGLDRYGENGGNQYFRYTSATSKGTANRGGGRGGWNPSHDEMSTSQDHYVPEYRRNLFLNKIPIEDNSSYRVTVYVKPSLKAELQKGIIPRIGVSLLRGSWHSEKPFLVDAIGVSDSWSINYSTFDDKKDYTDMEADKWNKVTLMAYYNNDSIGDASPYLLGYYWNNDWDWNVKVDNEGTVLNDGQDGVPTTLKFIKQPDKFFIRMAFRSDSTQFDVDNISVTKSWIGGAEYFRDMLRVDFGYQTNLGELAEKEKAENKIGAVQLPSDYFDVWALWRDDANPSITYWEKVPILTAEYQDDGYMYLWTEPSADGDERAFDGADSVLVSFYNSQLPDNLKLLYTGNLYPNGLDKEWIASGKQVFDFHNEVASYNPTIGISPVTKKHVKSLVERCPVLQKEPYEDGTFGLDPKTRSLRFKFSKNLSFDNAGKQSSKTKVILRGNGKEEYWNIVDYSADDNSGWTTIERPAEFTEDLAGDYVLSFEQVTHLKNPDPNNPEDYGDPVKLNYHFGDFSVDPQVITYFETNWNVEENETECVPLGTARIDHDNKTYKEGDGKKAIGSRMYRQSDAGQCNCTFYLAPRGDDTDAQFYIGVGDDKYSINLNAGITYQISFYILGWDNKAPTNLYIFPKPDEINPSEVKTEDKTKIAEFTPTNQVANNVVRKADYVITTADSMSYQFTVPADGKYIVEFEMPSSAGWNGTLYSDIHITEVGDFSDVPVLRINKAIASAAKMLAAADAAKYRGADYDVLTRVKSVADGFIAIQKASMVNLPSVYETEGKEVDAAVSALKFHMDTVDAFDKAFAAVEAKLAVYADSLKAFEELAVVTALKDVKTTMSDYAYSEKVPGAIAADTKTMNDAIKAVDDRQAINDQFITAIAEAEHSLANPKAVKYTAEFLILEEAINDANAFDAVSATNDELKAQIITLNEARFDIDVKILAADVSSVRIKGLDRLAKSLNASYGEAADEINTRIANIDFDDENLAKIMKAAIKVALYKKIVESSENVTEIDLTPFIKNYNLYANTTDAISDHSSKVLPGDRYDDELKGSNNPGSQIMKVGHQWGSAALDYMIWVLMYGEAFDNIFPGWTVESFITDHGMVTPDNLNYTNLSKGVPVFDGAVSLDWNSKAQLKTIVEDLPAGIYTLGATLVNNGSGNNTSVTFSVATNDSVVTKIEKPTRTTTVWCSLDNLVVSDGNFSINLDIETKSSSAILDNFTLSFHVDDNIDYATALEYAEAEYYAIVNGLPYEPYHPEAKVHRMYTDKVSVMAGKNVTIPIKMKNTDNITAFSLDVEIPSGTSFIGAELTGARSNGHGLSSNVSYDWSSNRSVVSLACLSLENKVFAGNDGVIVNITLNIPENMNEGEYSIVLKNIEMAVSPTKKYNPESYSSIINVIEPYVPGDVNNDGSITITDAVGVVAFIIESNTQNLCRRAADADENGVIDVADAVWVVNRVVRKYNAPLRYYDDRELTSTLSLCGESAVPMSLPLNVEGTADEITAMQFKLLLPDNLSLKRISTDNNHLVMSNKKDDGSYTVVCFSLDNSSFAGNGNAAMVLDFASDGQFDGGVVSVENAQLVSPDLRSKSIGMVKAMLTNSGDQTRIPDIESDGESGLFDMQGRSLSQPDGIYIRGGIKQIDSK